MSQTLRDDEWTEDELKRLESRKRLEELDLAWEKSSYPRPPLMPSGFLGGVDLAHFKFPPDRQGSRENLT